MARTIDPAKHTARRQQIIDTAAVLFATKGFDATTTAEICRTTGMSPGNLFHYFASKREIFFAVINDGEDEKAEQLAQAGERDDAWNALLDVVDLIVESATHPLGPPLVMEVMVQAQRDPELVELLSRIASTEIIAVETLIDKAVGAGEIDPGLDTRTCATWIAALTEGFYSQAAGNPAFDPAEELRILHLVISRFLRHA